MSVLNVTLNYQMEIFQFWSYGERGVHFIVIYEALCFDVALGRNEWGTQWDTNSLVEVC